MMNLLYFLSILAMIYFMVYLYIFAILKKRRYACELFSATFLFDTSLKGVMLRSSHIVEEIKPRTSTFVPLNLGTKVRQRDEICIRNLSFSFDTACFRSYNSFIVDKVQVI